MESVRILVVGDSGVGKTSLLRAICRVEGCDTDHRLGTKSHRWTVGCDAHVKLYQYRDTYNAMHTKDVFIEFIDVGGHAKYDISRAGCFYHDLHGIMFVHDITNVTSYKHLKKWWNEVNELQRIKGCVLPSNFTSNTSEFPPLSVLPMIIIGNKKDQIVNQRVMRPHPVVVPALSGVENIEASAEPFSIDRSIFNAFLDRVVSFANTQNTTPDYGVNGLRHTNTKTLSPSLGSYATTWW